MKKVTLIHASMTGNAEFVAETVKSALEKDGHTVKEFDLNEEEGINFLHQESDCIVGVTSTWGEGEPPEDAVPFFENLRNAEPLKLNRSIAVLSLGDSSYDIFCGCGKELEKELIRHGGTPLLERVDCDIDYEDDSDQWIENLVEKINAA